MKTLQTKGIQYAVLILTLFLFAQQSRASHIKGGDIQYKCLGNDQYEVTLNLIRDCSGISAPLTANIAVASSCGANFNHILPLVNSHFLGCSSDSSGTTCGGGGTPGYMRYQYSSVITLQPSCLGEWTFNYYTCCLSSSFVNLINPGALSVNLSASINTNISPCNDSPEFLYGQDYPPVLHSTPSQQTNHFMGGTDPDGDRLQYSYIPYGSNVYNFNQYVINGCFGPGGYQWADFNEVGNLRLHPGSIIGSYLFTYRVRHLNENNQIIGHTYRQIPIFFTPGLNAILYDGESNIASTASFPDTNRIEMCPGDSFCFDVTFHSTDSTDTVTLFSDIQSRLPGATFTTSGTNPTVATVCWTAVPLPHRYTNFGVWARNDSCGASFVASNGWEVAVKTALNAGPDQTICQGQSIQLQTSGGGTPVWTVLAGPPMVIDTNFSCDTCFNPIASPSATTTYLVTDVAGFTCDTTDTVTITVVNASPPSVVLSNDTIICQNDVATFTASGGNLYSWNTGDTLSTITANLAGLYIVTVTDAVTGCFSIDSVSLDTLPDPTILTTPSSLSICPGATNNLSAFGSPLGGSFLWSNGSSFATQGISQPGTYSVTYTAPNGCTAADTTQVTFFPSAYFNTLYTNDTTICQGEVVNYYATGNGSISWNGGLPSPSFTASSAGTYTVSVTTSNNCITTDTVVVSQFPTNTLMVSNDTTICVGDSALMLATGGSSYLWSTGSTGPSAWATAPGTYTLNATDTNGCTASNSVNISQAPMPNVSINPNPALLCPGDSVLLVGSGVTQYLWSNGASSNSTYALSIGSISVIGSNSFGCNAFDTALVQWLPPTPIAGTASDSNNAVLPNTLVYLIKYFNAQDSVVLLDSVLTDANGFYFFNTTEAVVYVKVVPDSATYPNLLPSYSQQGAVFTQADSIVNLLCDTAWANVSVLHGSNPGGPGFLSGYVYQGAGKTETCAGDPVKGLSLLLRDENNQFVAQTYTDELGFFEFKHLAPNTYSIWVDQPGINQNLAPEVVVAQGQNSTGLTFVLHIDHLEECIPLNVASPATVLQGLNVFPNPNYGAVEVEFYVPNTAPTTLSVMDAQGKVIRQLSLGLVQGSFSTTVDLSDLASGLYFLQVTSDSTSASQKIIRQ